MTRTDLDAIRARDDACNVQYAHISARDRRDLLEFVDALAAARKVTCWRCLGVGVVSDEGASCPDCAPLLEILNKVTAP